MKSKRLTFSRAALILPPQSQTSSEQSKLHCIIEQHIFYNRPRTVHPPMHFTAHAQHTLWMPHSERNTVNKYTVKGITPSNTHTHTHTQTFSDNSPCIMLEQRETRGKLISVETKLCVFCFLLTKIEVVLGRK